VSIYYQDDAVTTTLAGLALAAWREGRL